MKKISVGKRLVGGEEPCFIIAEAGANFKYSDDPKKNFKHALKLIDIAAEAKADAVKFQLYLASRLYTKKAGYADYIGKKKSIYEIIEDMELPPGWIPKLKKHCDKRGVFFLASPFDEESTDELEDVGVEAYKIASYTITHKPLIQHIAQKGRPIILSTGASSIQDIERAMEWIRGINSEVALMQCTAKYPAPPSTLNIRVIPELKNRFKVPVGFSDHSREPIVAPLGAVALGADVIEKHYTTDNTLDGPDHGFAILPNELRQLVESVRWLEEALGDEEKVVQDQEEELYTFARRSIHAIDNVKRGEGFSRKNIAVLRDGKVDPGLAPEHFESVLGKKAARDIKADEGITRELIE